MTVWYDVVLQIDGRGVHWFSSFVVFCAQRVSVTISNEGIPEVEFRVGMSTMVHFWSNQSFWRKSGPFGK